MAKTVTITVEIPEELKEEVDKYRIDVEGVVRRALIEEVRRAKAREQDKKLEEEWEKIKPILEKIPPEEVTRSIREDRGSG